MTETLYGNVPLFVTLGMFIVDEIHYPPPRPPAIDIIGGAGSYAALGARICLQRIFGKLVAWVVDVGNDFPPQILKQIRSWDTNCLLRQTPDRLTTRGWNGYTDDAHSQRAFKYMTAKRRIDENALTNQMINAESFHLICSPSRCVELVNGILARRDQASHDLSGKHLTRPIFIWEPVPDLCTVSELARCYEALKLVDVVSPNHHELMSFFQEPNSQVDEDDRKNVKNDNASVLAARLQNFVQNWLDSGVGLDSQGAVVVRAGKYGCFMVSREFKDHKLLRIPAFHEDQIAVVDPTGGGNAFLGGMATRLAILATSKHSNSFNGISNIVDAALWGSTAASFAIEQVGMPSLKHDQANEVDLWNGDTFDSRLAKLKQRFKEM